MNNNIDDLNKLDVDSGIEDEYDFEDLDDRIILTSKAEDDFFNEFYCWLLSCDGGFKKPRAASQHKSVIMSILHYVDSSGKNYQLLFSRNDLNSWITMFEAKGRKPGTIKTYLGSIKLFYEFVNIMSPPNVQVTPAELNKMKSVVAQWARNYNKKIKIAKHAKQLEDLAQLPTPEEIRRLDNSDHTKEAIKILNWFQCHDIAPTRKQYCLARDFLITYSILDNASRSGCISNMLMKEYESVELQSDGDHQ